MSSGREVSAQADQVVRSSASSPGSGARKQDEGSAKMPFFCRPETPTNEAAPPGLLTMAPGRAPTRKNEKPGVDLSTSITEPPYRSTSAISLVAVCVTRPTKRRETVPVGASSGHSSSL